jgi:hypothetical protein
MVGDSPWEIVTALSNADAAAYFDDRKARGFNTMLIELFEHSTTQAFGTPTLAGVQPFKTALPGSSYPDFSLPNDAYFAHVDEIVAMAAARGFLVLFTPAYLGYNGGGEGWYQEMVANGTARLTAFGNYVGKRYASSPNVMWVDGGDYNPPDKTLTRAVANGIKAFDSQHLHTAHARDGYSAMDTWAGEPWLDVDTVYDDFGITNIPVYNRCEREFARVDWKPFFFIEGCYEDGNCGGEVLIRDQAYTPMLTGGFGQIFGHGKLWYFPSTWKSLLDSQGTSDMTRLKNLFAPRRWDLLVPHTDGSFLTPAASGTSSQRASGAVASDGSFGIAYLPDLRDVTISTARFTRSVTARWYDPTNGAFSTAVAGPIVPGTSFVIHGPGNNSRGKADWVLLLE